MATTGRYVHCPMAGKIRKDTPNLLKWIRKRLARQIDNPLRIVDYYPAVYPIKNDR